jgi:hypothetical protein
MFERVTLRFSTPNEGGLTPKDFDGAAMAEREANLWNAAQDDL